MACQRVRVMLGLLTGGILLAAAPAARGQTFTWNNVTGNWNGAANWVGGTAPTGGSLNDTLIFGGNTNYTATSNPNLTQMPGFYLNTLNLTSTAGAPTITSTGSSPGMTRLIFGGTSPGISQTGSGAVTVSAPIYSNGGTLNISAGAGSGQLTVNGGVFGGGTVNISNSSANPILLGSVSGTLNVNSGTVQGSGSFGALNINSGGTFISNGATSLGSLSGAGTIQASASGSLFISGSSNTTFSGSSSGSAFQLFTYGGGTLNITGGTNVFNQLQVEGGVLRFGDAGAASAATFSATISNGGTLLLDNSTATSAANVNNRLGTNGGVALGGGTLTLLGRNSTSSSQSFNSNGGGLDVQAFGNQVIVTAGTGGTATLTFSTVSRDAIYNPGSTVDFSLNSGANVVITNPFLTNNIIGGYATVGNDWASINGSNQIIPLAAANYTTTTNPNAWVSTNNVKVNAALSNNLTTSGTINSLNFASNQTLTLNSGVTLTVASGGILSSNGGTISGGTITSSNGSDLIAIVQGSANTLTINSAIANQGANQVSLTKSGAGTLILGGTNTYTGGTFLNAGTLQISSASNLGTGQIDMGSGSTLQIVGGGTVNLNQDIQAYANATLDTGTATVTVGSILSSGVGNVFTKQGSGMLILTGEFNGGNTAINAGTIRALNNGSNVSFSGNLSIAGGAVADSSYASTSALTQLDGLSGAGNYITYAGGDLRIGFAGGNFSGSISQAVNGVASSTPTNLLVIGNGNLTLSGSSSYSGTTQVLNGTLQVGANVAPNTNGPLGNANSAIILGGNYAGFYSPGPGLNGDSALLISTPGVSIGRNITVASGYNYVATLGSNITSGTATYSGNVALQQAVQLSSASGGTTVFSGVLSGSGGIAAVGPGIVELTGTSANTFNGQTTVGNGTLVFGKSAGVAATGGNVLVTGGLFQTANANQLLSTSAVTVNGGSWDLNSTSQTIGNLSGTGGTILLGNGSLTANQTSNLTYGGVISGNASSQLVKQGSGALTLTGANTYSGSTAINGGILFVNNTTGSGTGSGNVSVNNTGTLGGTGTISGSVSVALGGTIAPGNNGVGTLTAGGLTMNSGSNFLWYLGANSTSGPGSNFSQLALTSNSLSIDPNAMFVIDFIGSADAPNSGDPFWDVSHTWDDVIATPTTPGGNGAFTINNSAWSSYGTFSTFIDGDPGIGVLWTPNPAEVPEPSSLALLGLTAAGAAYARWRRKKQAAPATV